MDFTIESTLTAQDVEIFLVRFRSMGHFLAYDQPHVQERTNFGCRKNEWNLADQDTSIYFKDKAIWKCGEAYRKQQGRYPVILLTFKDIKFSSWASTMDKIRELLQTEFH